MVGGERGCSRDDVRCRSFAVNACRPRSIDSGRPRQQHAPGMLCDLDTGTFWVPPEKLDKLQALLREALNGGHFLFRALQRIACSIAGSMEGANQAAPRGHASAA